jgi:hypothetical protein
MGAKDSRLIDIAAMIATSSPRACQPGWLIGFSTKSISARSSSDDLTGNGGSPNEASAADACNDAEPEEIALMGASGWSDDRAVPLARSLTIARPATHGEAGDRASRREKRRAPQLR